MTPQDEIKPPKLSYAFEFAPREYNEALACVNAHGFAIIKQMIDKPLVDELREAVRTTINPNNDMKPGEFRVRHAFMEFCPTVLKLLDHKPWLDLVAAGEGSDDLRFHRNAAIIRNPGAPCVAWHSDWSFRSGLHKLPPLCIDDVLNTQEGLGGRWFYLEHFHCTRSAICLFMLNPSDDKEVSHGRILKGLSATNPQSV